MTTNIEVDNIAEKEISPNFTAVFINSTDGRSFTATPQTEGYNLLKGIKKKLTVEYKINVKNEVIYRNVIRIREQRSSFDKMSYEIMFSKLLDVILDTHSQMENIYEGIAEVKALLQSKDHQINTGSTTEKQKTSVTEDNPNDLPF
ncbi:MAG: hypothetical protein IJR99_06960 [Kiritimatiellae bacterium]|nr:hypothetical protein [Kiritimatiellia bacterium]